MQRITFKVLVFRAAEYSGTTVTHINEYENISVEK